MNYKESRKFYESIDEQHIEPDLKNVYNILEILNNPQNDYYVVHITGTNGKGSTAMYINNMLKENNIKVGLFLSPYIEKPNEMILVNGKMITDNEFAQLTDEINKACNILKLKGLSIPTSFECYTALALLYFKIKKVKVAVIEVGMGGTDDATNVFDFPHICVFTSISLDHKKELGNNIKDIALNKSGIIKENCKVVLTPEQEEVINVIKNKVLNTNSKMYKTTDKLEIKKFNINGKTKYFIKNNYFNIKNIELSMEGDHQLKNLSTALMTIELLKEKYKFNNNKIREGIKKTFLPCRVEIIYRPYPIIFDAAHNVDSIEKLLIYIKNKYKNYNKHLLFGCLADKEVDNILKMLSTEFGVITLVEANSKRRLLINDMEKIASKYFSNINKISDAYLWMKNKIDNQKVNDLIVCTGSFYVTYSLRNKIYLNK